MARFRYSPEIVERFPHVVGGVIHASRVSNGPTSPELTDEYWTAQQEALVRIGTTPLSEIPSLAAWRRAFRAFGVDPTRYRSAAEGLLRRLTKQGDVPSIGTLVDLANLTSIRHALPVAVFDVERIAGGTTVRYARGDEPWTDLGSSTAEHPDPGEVVFIDDAGVVVARRWCWRQSLASAAHDATSEILVTVEGHHEGASLDVAEALDDLERLLLRHASARTTRRAVLHAAAPQFE